MPGLAANHPLQGEGDHTQHGGGVAPSAGQSHPFPTLYPSTAGPAMPLPLQGRI